MKVIIAVAAATALFMGPAQAAIAVGNKLYEVVDGAPGAYLAAKVQAAYQSGQRPARTSDWPAIKAAAGGNPLINLLGQNEFALWDESNLQWVIVNLAYSPSLANPFPAGDPTLVNSTLLVQTNADIQCVTGQSTPINIMDSYPGFTINDIIIDSCLCYSQYSGQDCSLSTTATNCPNATVVAMTANTGQQIIRDGTNGGTINPLAETVEFEIDSPQVATRNYSRFNWVNCETGMNTNGRLTNNVLRKFEVNTAQSSCNDGWVFGWLVSGLRDTCGLQQDYRMYDGSRDGVANNSWVRYRGDLMMYYTEMVTLPINNGTATQQLTRTGRLVTPIDVYIPRLYAAELNTTTSIYVFSPFQLKAAITATNVKASQTTATVDITFGLNPYEIKYISNQYTGDGTGLSYTGVPWVPLNNAPDIAAAYVINSQNNIVNTPTVTQSSNAGLSPCNLTDFDSNGFCWRTVRVLIVTDTACTLDHKFTFNTIAVGCNNQYIGNDCPLPTLDTSSSASFTVRAADYCDGQRALVIQGDVVIKAYVPQRDVSRTSLNLMRDYVLNENAWLTLFIDADKSLKVYRMTAIDFQTKLVNGVYTSPPDAASYISAVNSNDVGWNGYQQGFDVYTQSHTMAVTLDCNFVVDGNNNCLVAPGNGDPPSVEIYARLTFYVDYEPVNASGRRRRQAAQTDRGYAAIDAKSTVTTDNSQAEAVPSAASGVYASSPLIAMVAAAVFALLV